MLVYRSHNPSLTAFYNSLENLLSYPCIDIVLGDFNINAVNRANMNVQHTLSNYMLLVNESTHVSGSMVDHVYFYGESLQKFSSSKVQVLSIYFLDHDAVKFRLYTGKF